MDEKNMQFANFNITFGEDDAPMLEHFSDIIFPAFSGNYIRGKRDSVPRYSFGGIQIKEIDNEYVMVGISRDCFFDRNDLRYSLRCRDCSLWVRFLGIFNIACLSQ